MLSLCFHGHYQREPSEAEVVRNRNKDIEIDVYEMIALGLKIGLRMEDMGNMDFVFLINLLDTIMPKKVRKPTQADIDMIT